MKKKLFTFTVTYYKPNGKFYIRDNFDYECSCCGDSDICYMQDVVDRLKLLRSTADKMPGLSGSWDGYITVDCEDGHPCLIVAEIQ